MYLVTCTRPVIGYPVFYLSQFLAPLPSLILLLLNVSYYTLQVPRIENWVLFIRMHRKLLWKDTPTLTMEIVWTLGKAFPVTFFGSTIPPSVGVPKNKSLW
jgi:hypothetical protein